MNYLFCYDITDPKRLKRAAKKLEQRGLRIQKSFFEFHGTEEAKDLIKKDLLEVVDTDTDRFYVYPLCNKCVKQANTSGTGSLLEVKEYMIL